MLQQLLPSLLLYEPSIQLTNVYDVKLLVWILIIAEKAVHKRQWWWWRHMSCSFAPSRQAGKARQAWACSPTRGQRVDTARRRPASQPSSTRRPASNSPRPHTRTEHSLTQCVSDPAHFDTVTHSTYCVRTSYVFLNKTDRNFTIIFL